MTVLRVLLVSIFTVLTGYTLIVISHHGANLLPIFFGDIRTMAWPGQFNLDFSFMLVLSGLWVSWRHRFSFGGMALGLAAALGGALFLSAYLFVESLKAGGSVRALILGANQVN